MIQISRQPMALRLMVLAGVASLAAAAQAGETTPAPNGVMTFPNVKVVNAPPLSTRSITTAVSDSRSGMIAYFEPSTGQLVGPSAEAAAALAAAGAGGKFSISRSAQAASAEASPLYGVNGGIGVALDQSQDSYLVVRKDSAGHMSHVCVENEAAAHAVLKAPAAVRKAKSVAKLETK